MFAGEIPKSLYALIAHIVGEQEALDDAIASRSLEKAFNVFVSDQQVCISLNKARELFDQMVENTKKYLTEYFK